MVRMKAESIGPPNVVPASLNCHCPLMMGLPVGFSKLLSLRQENSTDINTKKAAKALSTFIAGSLKSLQCADIVVHRTIGFNARRRCFAERIFLEKFFLKQQDGYHAHGN